jgi:hypothetical protein
MVRRRLRLPRPASRRLRRRRGGRPRVLKRFAAEAWRRADAGELADEELYPCDAQWSGLYDRMHTHEDDETARRFQIAADYGEPRDGSGGGTSNGNR